MAISPHNDPWLSTNWFNWLRAGIKGKVCYLMIKKIYRTKLKSLIFFPNISNWFRRKTILMKNPEMVPSLGSVGSAHLKNRKKSNGKYLMIDN